MTITGNQADQLNFIGTWHGEENAEKPEFISLEKSVPMVNRSFFIVSNNGRFQAISSGTAYIGLLKPGDGGLPLLGYLPACPPGSLGDPSFCRDYKLRYPYVAGSMAHGISSLEMVKSFSNNGMLSFFGSAGLSPERLAEMIEKHSRQLKGGVYGFNLIHTPNEPALEAKVVDLYLKKGVNLVEASAFLDVTLPLVRYRVHGIYRDPSGRIVTPNRIIAKVSRVEIARKFFSPPPDNYLRRLVERMEITPQQAELASQIPLARDVTAEADSGGHTDNRPAITLLPTIIALRNEMQDKYNYEDNLRVGAAGGISTPASAAAAFSMGAAYVLTGSVNQACVESGTSDAVREILTKTQQADVTEAHAADMFEMGVKLQVVKRGTMFPMRSKKLFEIYNAYNGIEEIPPDLRQNLETKFFRATFEEVWQQTCDYFSQRDPAQIQRAKVNPKHKMALIFRWYLGQTSHWAISGDPSRKIDYQIWCGPAMGAFNNWVKGSFLEKTENRKVVTVALNILHGACIIMRLNYLKLMGIEPINGLYPAPIPRKKIQQFLTVESG